MLTTTKIKLQNKTSVIEVDLHGGAITDFRLKENSVNPLSFRFSKEQMPENNKKGAIYQGHFLCAGRWGEPSDGEIKAGIPNHGEPANIEWQLTDSEDDSLKMETTSQLEGLQIRRIIRLSESNALCQITETITNINVLGRLYQLVQHPTIAAPFLSESTEINCNATKGFEYRNSDNPTKNIVDWSLVNDDHNNQYDLRFSKDNHNAVFSFIVNPNDEYGWITACSAKHNLVLGYVWKRKDYAWINLWQHFENDSIKYRGLEFGTTGLHQPSKRIIENNNLEVFNERTVGYIDAGESIIKKYIAFLVSVPDDFKGVNKIEVKNNIVSILENENNHRIQIGNINFSET